MRSHETIWRFENEMNVSQNQKNDRSINNLKNLRDSHNSNNELYLEEGEQKTEYSIENDGDELN